MFEHHIMITEDEPEMAKILVELATEVGFVPHVALDMKDIVETYEKYQPQVIILDIVMPDMDGFEILHFLQQRQSNARILIVSGQDSYRSMAERLGEAQGLNIDANFRKPFRVGALRLALQEICYSLPSLPAPKRKEERPAA